MPLSLRSLMFEYRRRRAQEGAQKQSSWKKQRIRSQKQHALKLGPPQTFRWLGQTKIPGIQLLSGGQSLPLFLKSVNSQKTGGGMTSIRAGGEGENQIPRFLPTYPSQNEEFCYSQAKFGWNQCSVYMDVQRDAPCQMYCI